MVLIVGAPYFSGDAKAKTAILILIALWGFLLEAHLAKSISHRPIKKMISILEGILPKTKRANGTMSPMRTKAHKVSLDCAAVSIAALVGEDLNDARWLVIMGMVFAALAVAYQYEDAYKKSVVFGGWAIVAVQCGIGFTSNKRWEDGEILLIAAEALLSHVASTLGIDFDPNLH